MFDANQLLNNTEKQAIIWLWDNRELLEQRYQQRAGAYLFDYPDYGGMENNLYSVLSSELVDWVQDQTQLGFPDDQLDFIKKAVKAQL